MEINVQDGWARSSVSVNEKSRKYDVVLVRHISGTDVWANTGKKHLIAKILGVAYVGVSEDMPNYYSVQFDARYDQMLVEEQIIKTLMEDLEHETGL